MNSSDETVTRLEAGHLTLDDVAAEFPRWHCWRGVAGLVYARLPKSSPPVVVRAVGPSDLIDKIRGEIRRLNGER